MSAPPLARRYRTALVTGASTGLGRAFAEMLVAEGVEVWGTARDTARLAARQGFHPVALELGDGDGAERVLLEIDRASGGLDLLVNNAGFGAFGRFAETEFSTWQRQMEIMLVNTARLNHAALRCMLPRGRGAIVNVSSLAAEFALPYQPAYNVVKSGLSALSESLMYEVEGTGIVVIDFRPGDYRTDFEGSVVRASGFSDEQQRRAWGAFHRLMKSGPPPGHAADSLRRALARGKSGTVRTGRFFQAVVAPFLVRLSSLRLRRRVQSRYFDL
jgi:short-subunit dehydrogenase